MAGVIGVLLAAGAGSRMGRPKALVCHDDGTPWLATARRALLDGGCTDVITVLGARAQEAGALIPGAWTVTASNWQVGMSASLSAGLSAIDDQRYDAAMIHLVDLPDVGAAVVARMAAYGAPAALARAVYRSMPGHPVMIGRNHWRRLNATLAGDTGARDYLSQRGVTLVQCADLAGGHDVDCAPAGPGDHPGGPILDA